MRSILERAKRLVFKAKFCRYIKIFQKILTKNTGFLSVPKLVRVIPVRHALRDFAYAFKPAPIRGAYSPRHAFSILGRLPDE